MMSAINHTWNQPLADAIELQERLAAQVDSSTPIDQGTLRYVAGVDVSVKDGISRAAVVVLTFPDLVVVERVRAQMPTPFPYIPGLLSFREGPVILEAARKLKTNPGAYIFDGQGIAHPRRLGIAAHMGLWLDAPTVGCAKTWLIGDYDKPGLARGDYSMMWHRGEVIGAALRTRTNVNVVYVSAGHRATHDSARELILACSPRYRLPEPVRAAHKAAGLTRE